MDVYTAQLREEVTAESAGLDQGDEGLLLSFEMPLNIPEMLGSS